MEAGKQVKQLPMCLGDALKALERDEVIQTAMPSEMYRLFMEYKTDEWERFLGTTTQWDMDTYLDCLPYSHKPGDHLICAESLELSTRTSRPISAGR